MTKTLQQTERSRLRRAHNRGAYDLETIYGILDAQPLCTVGYVMDGKPYVTPTLQWREGDYVYWHGSSASRALRAGQDEDVCLSVSILDGFVLARSGFHHSVNSRSVTVFGKAMVVEDTADKQAHLTRFLETLFPGRAETLRPDHLQDLKATKVLRLRIEEASAKVRTGGPIDEEDDYALPIWAGEIPIHTIVGDPVVDPRVPEGVPIPAHVRNFRIGSCEGGA